MKLSNTLSKPLVDVAWVAAHLDDPDVRVIELDVAPTAYAAGHIPGAVFWNAYTDLRDPGYRPMGRLHLQQLLRKSGIADGTTVVFYGYAAHLGFWLLTSHEMDSILLMDGPREQWTRAGHRWSTATLTPVPSDYALASQSMYFSSKDDLLAKAGSLTHVILDTRTKEEYDGKRFWPSGAAETAGRAGHIPGASHFPVELLRTEDGGFRKPSDMLTALSEHGVAEDASIVTYCTIGNRASQAWFALTYLLGREDVRVYYGSWAEWGKLADVQVAN